MSRSTILKMSKFWLMVGVAVILAAIIWTFNQFVSDPDWRHRFELMIFFYAGAAFIRIWDYHYDWWVLRHLD